MFSASAQSVFCPSGGGTCPDLKNGRSVQQHRGEPQARKHPPGTHILPGVHGGRMGQSLTASTQLRGQQATRNGPVGRHVASPADVGAAGRGLPVQGCSWYGDALTSCPTMTAAWHSWAPSGWGDRHALAQQAGTKSSTERAEM